MAVDTTPAVRATFVIDLLNLLADRGRRDEVVAALPPSTREAIAALTPLQWVDAAHMVALYDAAFATLGGEAAARLCHDAMVWAFRQGAFREVFETARRMNGRTPASILKYSPSVWAQSTRGAGVQKLALAQPRRVDMEWTEVPASIVSSNGYVDAMKAKYLAHLDVFGLQGRVEVTRRDPAAGVLVFSLVW